MESIKSTLEAQSKELNRMGLYQGNLFSGRSCQFHSGINPSPHLMDELNKGFIIIKKPKLDLALAFFNFA